MKKSYLFVILGQKYWDKTYGNTYNSAIIVCPNGETIFTDYEYGYGNDYYDRAHDKIYEYCKDNDIPYSETIIRNLGAYYTRKNDVKKHIVY